MSSDNGTPGSDNGTPDPAAQDPAEAAGGPPSSRRTLIIVGVIASVAILGLLIALIWALATRPATAPSTPSASASGGPSATPSQSPSATPTPTATSTPDAATCTVDELTLSLGQSDGGTGSTVVPIIFANSGTRDCELEGFPGVSLVGDENGTQLGAAAAEDDSVPIEVFTLAPGDTVQALVTVTNAGNYDTCGSETADGFRVYPPHSFEAVFVPTSAYAPCTDESVELMRTTPVQAG